MSGSTGFHLDWYAGASAQLELFAPKLRGRGGNASYQLKYTPPFRSTIKPPIEERALGRPELEPINEQLDSLATILGVQVVRQPSSTQPSPSPTTGADTIEDMKLMGQQLLDLLVPYHIQVELRGSGFFLELGMDEALLEYPWELMHDGDNFLCLKHFVGRSVNAASQTIPSLARPTRPSNSELGELSILLISVPRPQARPKDSFVALTEAEEETKAIMETLNGINGLKFSVLTGKNATYDEVYKALSSGKYHIIHFNGHANYDDKDPTGSASSLVLYDRDMTANQLANVLAKNPPILCFMNACETGRTAPSRTQSGKPWKGQYSIFGLARAFLLTGSYLIGSRWKLGDQAAASFAKSFYSSLVSGMSLGYSITVARKTCMQASGEDQFSWASYIFYGDPRLCFRESTVKTG